MSSGGRNCPASREGTSWSDILQTLVRYRLIAPGNEWQLYRQWFEQQSAMGESSSSVATPSPGPTSKSYWNSSNSSFPINHRHAYPPLTKSFPQPSVCREDLLIMILILSAFAACRLRRLRKTG
jgi:hypothetical protein